ncbi:hypothetical protein Hanom_Chr03g00270081 [Helianthus anomalus]
MMIFMLPCRFSAFTNRFLYNSYDDFYVTVSFFCLSIIVRNLQKSMELMLRCTYFAARATDEWTCVFRLVSFRDLKSFFIP